jgi:TetR/AcrR family transcriptional regulator, tetracycline repressor protein
MPATKISDLALDADEIVSAAVAIFHESGLDGVSMRSVAARLGVSPVPLYSRVGNKEALVSAIADRLLADLAPSVRAGERWDAYAARWAREVRTRLRRTRESRLLLWPGRDAYVQASQPLVETMRRDGFDSDAAVQACRLLTWTVVGFGAIESGVEPPRRGRRHRRPGADPGGVSAAEVEALFDLQVAYLIDGIARAAAPLVPVVPIVPGGRTRKSRQ